MAPSKSKSPTPVAMLPPLRYTQAKVFILMYKDHKSKVKHTFNELELIVKWFLFPMSFKLFCEANE